MREPRLAGWIRQTPVRADVFPNVMSTATSRFPPHLPLATPPSGNSRLPARPNHSRPSPSQPIQTESRPRPRLPAPPIHRIWHFPSNPLSPLSLFVLGPPLNSLLRRHLPTHQPCLCLPTVARTRHPAMCSQGLRRPRSRHGPFSDNFSQPRSLPHGHAALPALVCAYLPISRFHLRPRFFPAVIGFWPAFRCHPGAPYAPSSTPATPPCPTRVPRRRSTVLSASLFLTQRCLHHFLSDGTSLSV
ncbi:hypothetical protein B0H21DRAFT_70265 [Amylocystis lapponica]|nr:hypothetical protein B0H21DRAFT_70265 [Amylocystis lapponica]